MNNQRLTTRFIFPLVVVTLLLTQAACQREELNQLDPATAAHYDEPQDDHELQTGSEEVANADVDHDDEESDSALSDSVIGDIDVLGCIKATSSQIAVVNKGNTMLSKFMSACYASTGNSPWCQQVARPNPASSSTFACTYGKNQPHYFIYPDSAKWKYAIDAVKLVQELQKMGVKVASIYNWWRPEPYNKNVGGAAGRHPYGTSVDVRFSSKEDQAKAHKQLCKWRASKRLRALGYYSSTSLHFGMGDALANTWGKSCP